MGQLQAEDRSLLDVVDERTNLAGANKMEILLFSIGTGECFGVNVFKVKEVCQRMPLTRTPNMPHGVDGIVSLRGHVMPVLNLARFMGVARHEPLQSMIVAEYSNHILGFLVHAVDRIIRVDWNTVHPCDESLLNKGGLVNALTKREDGTLVSLMDVEQILSSAFGDAAIGELEKLENGHELCVFYVDDSSVARRKISEVLDKMGVRQVQANNGSEAWERLKALADAAQMEGKKLHDQIQVILTDAEMPEMDGYVLTQQIKSDSRFDGIPVVMHSSLSSSANRSMGQRMGVDCYVPKFDPGALAAALRPMLVGGRDG
ncbi:MAG: fused signal transduction protein/response regulator [Gallionellales bacterium GWA2_55_18]|nr:MAG: fused signal transduction protein/response regulator [Gallionellales bacterium GWA2_55_18]